MNTFRQHLAEVYGYKDIKDLVFMNVDQADLALPISKKMFDRLLGERKKLRAVHLTDFKGFQDLIKLQRTRKQISVSLSQLIIFPSLIKPNKLPKSSQPIYPCLLNDFNISEAFLN